MSLNGERIGVGVDLVSRHRIQHFLSSHAFEFVKRLLTPSEQDGFQKTSDPLQFFARCFAAKEAYFKATGGAGMGEEGFRGIEIIMKGKERFCARESHPEESRRTRQRARRVRCVLWRRRDDEGSRSFVRLRRTQDDQRVDGQFFPTPDGIGARVLIWK